MSVRNATYNDLLPASKVLARAFQNEELFGQTMHPHRDEYPEDMYLYFLRSLRQNYFAGPDHHVIVCTKPAADDTSPDTITGVAYWERQRANEQKSTPWSTLVVSRLVDAYNYLESFGWPNRAADPSKLDLLERSGPFMHHHWTGTRAEVWYLAVLGVDPAFQRQAIGHKLVEWGFVEAKKEGVGLSVVSSKGKERFYQSVGFDVVVGTVQDEGGEANPLRDVEGGTILFHDNGIPPKGIKKYGEE